MLKCISKNGLRSVVMHTCKRVNVQMHTHTHWIPQNGHWELLVSRKYFIRLEAIVLTLSMFFEIHRIFKLKALYFKSLSLFVLSLFRMHKNILITSLERLSPAMGWHLNGWNCRYIVSFCFVKNSSSNKVHWSMCHKFYVNRKEMKQQNKKREERQQSTRNRKV